MGRGRYGRGASSAFGCPVVPKHLEVLRGRVWWYTPIIPAAQEAEIGRIMVQGQFRQTVRPHVTKLGMKL
jgi:hypothetical protein